MALRWSIRVRTTVAATAALVPVLAVAGAAGVWFQRDDLTNGIASLAEQQAREQVGHVPLSESELARGGEEVVVQVVDANGSTVLASSPGASTTPLLAPPPSGATRRGQVQGALTGEPDAYVAVAVAGSSGSYVVVARSLESVNAATASTTTLFLVGGILVVLAVGVLTWLATGRALAPVEAMRSRAASFSADDLDGRLPVPASADEVARLATTLNDLLVRLQQATLTQRRFVADASHELRSPIATMRALLESDRLAAHPGGHDGLSQELLDETRRLTALVDDLLALARGDAGRHVEQEPVDVGALAREEAGRRRRVPVSVDVSDGLWTSGDAAALTAAVRNLLDNAERFATSGIWVQAHQVRRSIRITVTDDGPGIPEDDRARVFDRFVRLDGSRTRDDGGTGLGLAIVRQVVGSHGGTVTIDGAVPGVTSSGARVTITLPLA